MTSSLVSLLSWRRWNNPRVFVETSPKKFAILPNAHRLGASRATLSLRRELRTHPKGGQPSFVCLLPSSVVFKLLPSIPIHVSEIILPYDAEACKLTRSPTYPIAHPHHARANRAANQAFTLIFRHYINAKIHLSKGFYLYTRHILQSRLPSQGFCGNTLRQCCAL